jgi:hypothetical protein
VLFACNRSRQVRVADVVVDLTGECAFVSAGFVGSYLSHRSAFVVALALL